MTHLTKKQLQERFFAEFLLRLREAPAGTRIFMPVGDVFKDADVVSLEQLRVTHWAAVVRGEDDEGSEPIR